VLRPSVASPWTQRRQVPGSGVVQADGSPRINEDTGLGVAEQRLAPARAAVGHVTMTATTAIIPVSLDRMSLSSEPTATLLARLAVCDPTMADRHGAGLERS